MPKGVDFQATHPCNINNPHRYTPLDRTNRDHLLLYLTHLCEQRLEDKAWESRFDPDQPTYGVLNGELCEEVPNESPFFVFVVGNRFPIWRKVDIQQRKKEEAAKARSR